MTAAAIARTADHPFDTAGHYNAFVERLEIHPAQRSQRRRGARLLLERHHDLAAWMTRPTAARLADLHRMKAWPFLTWLFVEDHLRADLELLLAKPGGVDIGVWWTRTHRADAQRAEDLARRLGWSANWTHQVIGHCAPVLCLSHAKTLFTLTDADFDDSVAAADHANVTSTTRDRFSSRCLALRQLCFQAATITTPPRDSKVPSLSPAEHAATISQSEIRRDVIRYAELISTTLRPSTAQMRIKAIRVLADWLTDQHPDVLQLAQIERAHIEQFLGWSRTRPFRGPNGKGKTVGLTVFHHDLVDLRVFFEDIAEWGWPTAPTRRLLFLSDLPRMPEPLPRALTPDIDRVLMAAVSNLDDPFTKCGLTLLRATGMRVGELLDLELDCIVDYARHGTWLRVPIGKLGTERNVPLDPEPLALLDNWIKNRAPHRSLVHPRNGRPTDFVFVERGRRIGAHRLRAGLATAIVTAGLTDRSGQTIHVTLHQLRHTFGTTLELSTVALGASLGGVEYQAAVRDVALGVAV